MSKKKAPGAAPTAAEGQNPTNPVQGIEGEKMSTRNDTPALAESDVMAQGELLDPISVDVRFAGGAVFVYSGPLSWEPGELAVRLAMPGGDLALRPHEARELASALLCAAAVQS